MKSRNRYFFRKRLAGQEQPSICYREGADGEDQLLVDSAARGTGDCTAVRPLRPSHDGNLLLYEVKQGGERTGTFEILDIANRTKLKDSLPHGYLRGFAFAADGKSFCYIHELAERNNSYVAALYQHVLGTAFEDDRRIFMSEGDKRLRLAMVSSRRSIGLLVFRFLDKTYTDFYIWRIGSEVPPMPILRRADFGFSPRLHEGRIFAAIDRGAPNRRIVEVQPRDNQDPLFFDLVPETDALVHNWAITANCLIVSYARGGSTQTAVFDLFGKRLREIATADGYTIRIAATSSTDDEILLERESFTQPVEILRFSATDGALTHWSRRHVPFDPEGYAHEKVEFSSKDTTTIPMFLVGRHEVLAAGPHPAIMTAYGGYGLAMTPRFSVLVALLLERGFLFALPNIRGGSEFGAEWHEAARRRKRQTAFDDFISAAQWLITSGKTTADQLAIFGGSNSGLLVAACMTQRPDLFRAVLCMVPLLDMLRFHLFDSALHSKDEFGTAEDPEDFAALYHYSPYHSVRDGVRYPSTMIVSGDADQNCNGLHARKMTARLQAATASDQLIILDYDPLRGHSPVLPLRIRIEALTDRIAFLCDRVGGEA